jgi:toluene monooxygenase electron transfer component
MQFLPNWVTVLKRPKAPLSNAYSVTSFLHEALLRAWNPSVYTVQISGTDQSFTCAPDDTLLRAALRSGIGFPYECNVGSCGNCKFELIEGSVTNQWPEAPGLSDKDRTRNRALGCQSCPSSDVQIKLRPSDHYRPVHEPVRTSARLVSARAITHDLSEFRVELAQPMAFAPGQYALVQLPGVTGARAYSMSNYDPASATALEFQVRRVPEGQGSAALFDQLKPGSGVQIDGPYGMAYLRTQAARDILCIAGGSGLAPMVSIARGAFATPALQARKLHFVYGARMPQDVCGQDMVCALPGWNERGTYHAAISGLEAAQSLAAGQWRGYVHEVVGLLYGAQLPAMEIYFAGPPLMAQALLKLLVERKVPMEQVHFDQFY